ncbi:MAG: hypothetical protein A4S16_00615 [Proteobacteria bacterium SG_bin6]|nr:MAG: hypothetical protein A4S16_00615 [Proteobacteria bacterium SG_bin6]
MRISAKRKALLLLVAGASVLPALAQERPESILPPGFNEQTPAPTPTPSAPVASTPAPAQPSAPLPGTPVPDDLGLDNLLSNDPAATAEADPAAMQAYELPVYARRSLARVGVVGTDQGGLAPGAFGRSDGRFLQMLMARLDAPLPSRWLSIALRRALASQVDTPAQVNGADFAAERAWLLVRMGEPHVARALIEAVDTDNYTPKLYEAALQTALAAGDPGLVCPVIGQAQRQSGDRAWVLLDAVCAGLSGIAGQGGPQLEAARKRRVASGVDLLLADKAVGLTNKRRAVTIEWDSVGELTAWRYGMAMATGVDVPAPLLATAAPRVKFWRAMAPALSPVARRPSAELAAAQGVLSSAALVDLYGAIDQSEDPSSPDAAAARDLTAAFSAAARGDRVAALRRLWEAPEGPRARYARLVLTARAAALLPPAADEATERAIASMLSAGYDQAALRWRGVVTRGSDGWAMLALANTGFGARYSRGEVRSYGGGQGDTTLKRQLFFAALAGLDRIDAATAQSLGGDLGVDIALDNPWTRAIDQAAQAGAPGTVLLLAGVGMQTANWHGVPPAYFYRIIAAMHRVGLDAEARMMAIEALTRL